MQERVQFHTSILPNCLVIQVSDALWILGVAMQLHLQSEGMEEAVRLQLSAKRYNHIDEKHHYHILISSN